MPDIAKFVRYYSFCLTDSQSGRASVTRASWNRQPYRRLGTEVLADERIIKMGDGQAGAPADLSLPDLTRADIEAWSEPGQMWVPVIWHPFVFERTHAVRHGIQTHQWAPDYLVPISILVYAHRDGRLMVVGRPRVSRECLEPAAQGSLILGSVEDADKFYEKNPFPEILPPTHESAADQDNGANSANPVSLAFAVKYAESLFDAVCQADPTQPIPGVRYERNTFGVTIPARQGSGAIDPLLRTYDAIETLSPTLPCLETLLKPMVSSRNPEPEVLSRQAAALNRWGTINTDRDLSEDQRTAIAACQKLKYGEVLAIHGPPGTGKTAILQEVVANSVVESVLQNREPDLLVVASTNNQAIRNALESLHIEPPARPTTHTETLLKRRWVEGWQTLGFYNAAMKAQELAKEANLPTLDDMERLERSADTQTMTMQFIQNARLVTQSGAIASIAAATDALSDLLKAEAKEQVWARNLPQALKKALPPKRLGAFIKAFLEHEQRWRKKGWLGADADIRLWEGVREKLTRLNASYTEMEKARTTLNRTVQIVETCWDTDWALKAVKGFRNRKGVARFAERRIQRQHPEAFEAIKTISQCEVEIQELKRTIRHQSDSLLKGDAIKAWRDRADSIIHRKARDRWFWLALHVREGQWLECMNTTLRAGYNDGRTQEKMIEQLRRRSLIAPVMVATLHRLPKILNYWDVQRQAEMPLFEHCDLLIVDEAGQSAPDVAAASVSLAKRLVALGDRAQLEPVWSLELREDLGNRVAANLVAPGELHSGASEQITRSGGDASTGSLLHLSEGTTRFASKGLTPAGIWLTQHRRCLPAIFGFCNDLAYKGKLSSARTAESVSPLPALAYMDLPGVDARANGSRENGLEAVAIAQFIYERAPELKAAYDKPIHEIVGVITPFKAQAERINQALNAALGLGHQITCGTVHALQGAERPVIIFSTTYSALPMNRSLFFDQTTSMLNVAVSRAQDTLLVAGDLDTLSGGGLPSRLLHLHLNRHGTRVDWPEFTPETPLADAWRQEISQVFGKHSSYKRSSQDHAIIKVLGEDEPGTVIMTFSDIDKAGLQMVGNACIKAVRKKGAKITWLISHEYLLEHPESRILTQALDTVRGNGVRVQYTGPIAANLILVPDHQLTLWGESSWMVAQGPQRFIASSDRCPTFIGRIKELHHFQTEEPETA